MSDSSTYTKVLSTIHSETKLVKDFGLQQEMNFEQVQVLCLVRDGSYYIKEFLQHYRNNGVARFIFLDNGSVDETINLLSEQDDVKLLLNKLPYKIYWHEFKRYLFEYYGKGTWNLLVDIDEFFDAPIKISITDLVKYNNYFGYTSSIAHMADLVPDECLKGKGRNDDFVNAHLYYSAENRRLDNYFEILGHKNICSNPNLKLHYGGWRGKEFDVGNIMLSKHPLIKGIDDIHFIHDHYVENAIISDSSCLLRHYKFKADFEAYVTSSVVEENHYDNSREYKAYLEKLSSDDQLNLYVEGMDRVDNTEKLLENQLIQISPAYILYFLDTIKRNGSLEDNVLKTVLESNKEVLNFERRLIRKINDAHIQKMSSIKQSWSWKIGYAITRIFAPVFKLFQRKN